MLCLFIFVFSFLTLLNLNIIIAHLFSLLAMEFKVEIKEEFFENNERCIESRLFTSTGIGGLKNAPAEDTSAMEVKAEIKKQLAEDEQGYIESRLTMSIDLGDLKNEIIDEDNSGERISIDSYKK
uniref:Uncharacterized protein LOC114347763 n=1 Tax=Diabrotica virgifera virgifera TaxID=50390 RepID=A0A6P7GWV1_DIAVI